MDNERYEMGSEDFSEILSQVKQEKHFPFDPKIMLVNDIKQKAACQIKKIPPIYAWMTEHNFVLTVNEIILDKLDEESVKILFHQELDRVEINLEKGTVKLGKLDLITSSGLINKFGIEKIARANQLDKLVLEKVEEGDFLQIV